MVPRQKPITKSQKRLSPFALHLSRLTSHVSLLTLLFVLPAFSQQSWWRVYGGARDDDGGSVQQTSDGGYIVAGFTSSFGNSDQVYLIKTDSLGDTLWTKTYGDVDQDWGYSVQQTSDSGYIIAGTTLPPGSNHYYHVYLIKTDASGDTLWSRAFGNQNSYSEFAYSVRQTSDGGYVVAGVIYGVAKHVLLIKTNASGDTVWSRVHFPGGQMANSVQQTKDGGYIVAGTMGIDNAFMTKSDQNGYALWTSYYGNNAFGYDAKQTSDGGYILVGINGYSDVYLIKTDANGDSLWSRLIGGATSVDYGYSVQQTSDGGYIITGSSNNFGRGGDVYLVKTDSLGDTLWTRGYGMPDADCGQSVQQTSDGGYIISGYRSYYGLGAKDVYLIKTKPDGTVGVEVSPSHQSLLTSYSAFPNPFTSFATVPGHVSERFALYDISGRKVGVFKGNRIGFGLSAGVYFLRSEGKEAKPLRVVKVR